MKPREFVTLIFLFLVMGCAKNEGFFSKIYSACEEQNREACQFMFVPSSADYFHWQRLNKNDGVMTIISSDTLPIIGSSHWYLFNRCQKKYDEKCLMIIAPVRWSYYQVPGMKDELLGDQIE